ncbi:N-acetylmuramoyl-L-alanine amidase family protein [Anaerotignum lactatifermentans]|uniref:N-acetylmuramoyl-L-alanine amidase family protein n=1 Tax=Anaerotignum lactatifermentans TaxID=160404 RepID=UPI00248DD394|nr:N-acetylmuramoyl-L-alanine amidase [Anaerotignum lactatifermentans]
MPRVYLSPSLQEYNLYVNGGTEEEITNLIADAMEPYLLASGIEFTRNRPEMSLGEAIAASNEGNYDLHFAIHSNAAPESLAGKLQGVDAYYFYNSPYGREMADIVTENMKQVYPDGEKVQSVATATLRELRRTNAPAVLVEVGYHDNIEDAQWIKENIDQIAKELAKSIADYFGVPFRQPQV